MQATTFSGLALLGFISFAAWNSAPDTNEMKAYAAWALSNNSHAPVVESSDEMFASSEVIISSGTAERTDNGFAKRYIPETYAVAGPVKNWKSYEPLPLQQGESYYELRSDGKTLVEVGGFDD